MLRPVVGLAWAGLFVTTVVAARTWRWWTPALIEGWLSGFGLWRAGAIYVVLYAVRPLVLFPATLLTVRRASSSGPCSGSSSRSWGRT